MCWRTYRRFRCGHKRYAAPDYCPDATYNRRTAKYSMCSGARSITAVADESLCDKPECYLRDLRRNGWTCCQCGEQGNRMDGCIGPPEGGSDCPHVLCLQCTYSQN
ncbi:hypothetical protein VD0002_g5280 [Verticillium dahliae]|uniref:Uncharacterized protein n=3 Tax=Verticillium TaxID=1036719 RepID=G2X546_VERDV|nr:hypothetical protein VDBG_10135 [Verticillium alfalfae VaMs.102]XP_009653309.1 uncharacterized protein VDAG_05278 [Verticillium dahliae VdLs.17]KAH6699493.1 hypothetical protein EV126DRAFT_365109 [Verticillium dahliae]EEY24025.1 hypothetical protein VDBG_10135 [Verticillium alfalfae VaMs.102]EGY23840.1 hypothetical protein VDAG_05278 [Verticillium dahliae VdLs.17]PNH36644.1 hypothetical protein BJF96_g614 [Verticillium dahliae]PNH41393.1 hypothetical protein VD0004_g5727 [Verticillium dahl